MLSLIYFLILFKAMDNVKLSVIISFSNENDMLNSNYDTERKMIPIGQMNNNNIYELKRGARLPLFWPVK